MGCSCSSTPKRSSTSYQAPFSFSITVAPLKFRESDHYISLVVTCFVDPDESLPGKEALYMQCKPFLEEYTRTSKQFVNAWNDHLPEVDLLGEANLASLPEGSTFLEALQEYFDAIVALCAKIAELEKETPGIVFSDSRPTHLASPRGYFFGKNCCLELLSKLSITKTLVFPPTPSVEDTLGFWALRTKFLREAYTKAEEGAKEAQRRLLALKEEGGQEETKCESEGDTEENLFARRDAFLNQAANAERLLVAAWVQINNLETLKATVAMPDGKDASVYASMNVSERPAARLKKDLEGEYPGK